MARRHRPELAPARLAVVADQQHVQRLRSVHADDQRQLDVGGARRAGDERDRARDRRAVVLQRGEETRVYAMAKPAAADLVLPAEVTMEIRDWKAELTAATTAAPPP